MEQDVVCNCQPKQTVFVLFFHKICSSLVPPIYYGNIRLQQVESQKHLCFIVTPILSWIKHIPVTISKVNRHLGIPKKYKYTFFRKSREIRHISFVRPILGYGDVLYDSCSIDDSNKLENVQLEVILIQVLKIILSTLCRAVWYCST